jgi:hypothetical protein
MSIILEVNYAPIVDSVMVEKVFSVYRFTMLVLPTDLSPIITTLKVIIFYYDPPLEAEFYIYNIII